MIHKLALIAFILLTNLASASTFQVAYSQFSADDFTDPELSQLYDIFVQEGGNSQGNFDLLLEAIQNPYAPAGSNAGQKFYEALAWYNDIVLGDRNGSFSLVELEQAIVREAKKYVQMLFQSVTISQRLSTWKMIQKLTLLKNEIVASGQNSYPYRPSVLNKINQNSTWNAQNTLNSRDDFEKRVLQASWIRPVLIKFGLPYCVHCLLMEHLGSVVGVSQKYTGKIDVYKLWWNPNDPQSYGELNQIASEEGITSSPIFNLYIDGKLVKSEYAFPDEQGNGLEDFLKDYL